jgi:hypothetical protein
MSTTEKVKATSLVLDFTLYPRMTVDDHHVSRLAEARRAGESFPPVIADDTTRRLTDGFHRLKTVLRVDGDDAMIDVEWRHYTDDADLFQDAITLNSRHGLRISRLDEAHCMAIAQRLGISPTQVASALTLTLGKFEELKASRLASSPRGEPVVLKGQTRHLAGQRLTAKQVAGNTRASGMSIRHHVDQVINAVTNGLVDRDDMALLGRLRELHKLLDAYAEETV